MVSLDEAIKAKDVDQRIAAVQQLKGISFTKARTYFHALLGDLDWRVRKVTCEHLLTLPSSESIPLFIEALYADDNAGKRNTAMEALHRLGEEALPFLLAELARNPEYDVRLALITMLGEIRAPEAYEYLLYALQKETDINILSAAVSSLGNYRKLESIPHLLKVLQKDNPWLQFHCIEALGTIGAPEAIPYILPYYEKPGLQKAVLDALGSIGHISAVPFILQILKREKKFNLNALRALMHIYHKPMPQRLKKRTIQHMIPKVQELFPRDKIPELLSILKTTPRDDVKRDILKLLGWLQDPQGLDALVTYLRNPDFVDTVTQSFVDFGHLAWEKLSYIFHPHEETETLLAILRILEAWAYPPTLKHLIAFLEHPETILVQRTLEVLRVFPSPELLPYLFSCLSHPDPGVQETATQTLIRLGEHSQEMGAMILEMAQKLLEDPRMTLRIHSLRIYVSLKGHAYEDIVIGAFGHPDPVLRKQAVQLMGTFPHERYIGHLHMALSDEDGQVRLQAIQALIHYPETDLYEALLPALKDPDMWIRASAVRALAKTTPQKALSPLLKRLSQELPPVRIAILEALGELKNKEAIPHIMKQLHHEDLEVVRAALLALGRIGTQKVIKILKDYTAHEDWRLRATAIQAMAESRDIILLEEIHRLFQEEKDIFVKQAALQAMGAFEDPSSYPYLLQALQENQLADAALQIFIDALPIYEELMRQTWSQCDKRLEELLSVALEEGKKKDDGK